MSNHLRPAECLKRLREDDRGAVVATVRPWVAPTRLRLGLLTAISNERLTVLVEDKLAKLLAYHWVEAGYATPIARPLVELARELEDGRLLNGRKADLIGDAILAEAIVHNEEEAIKVFITRYERPIEDWFRRLGIPWLATTNRAEGFIGELVIQHKDKSVKFDTYDGTCGLEPWLRRIIRNAANDELDAHKRETRRNETAASRDQGWLVVGGPGDAAPVTSDYEDISDFSAEAEFEAKVVRPLVEEAVGSLTSEQFLILRRCELGYDDPVSKTRMAALLEISSSELSKRLSAAKAALRAALERRIEQSPYRAEFETLLIHNQDDDNQDDRETRRTITPDERCLARGLGTAFRAINLVEEALKPVPKRKRDSLLRVLTRGDALSPTQSASLKSVGEKVSGKVLVSIDRACFGGLAEDAASQTPRFRRLVLLVLDRPKQRPFKGKLRA